MIRHVFLDLDDTILDFHASERKALSRMLTAMGLDPEPETLALYHRINKAHWQLLEQGKLTREQVLVNRFGELFRQLGRQADPEACAACYEENLSRQVDWIPGARELLAALKGKYRLCLASNGTARVQHGRLTLAGLYPWFDHIFISQELGYNKPDPRFFEAAFARIPDFSRDAAVMVGDSLSSDMAGSRNAGMTAIWFNPEGKAARDVAPDYTIEDLAQLVPLLETL